MKGIDISNWQNGINVSKMDADFVIVKATEGVGYLSPDFKRQADQTLNSGKLLGIYHYARGGNAASEANYFCDAVKQYLGKAILVLDWEGGGNPLFGKNDNGWCLEFCKKVTERTGLTPFIYVQKSAMHRVPSGYPLWVAQYANNNTTGYQSNPWNESAYKCAIRQYTSSGRLSGWNENLDLNKAYISKDEWNKYAGSKTESKPQNPKPNSPSGSTIDLALATLRGDYGNGEARKKNLGSRYDEIQNFINSVYSTPINTLVNQVIDGKYGNGETRKKLLGDRYNEVQNAINNKGNSNVYHTVKSGETLSGIALKYKTTWQNLQKMNNISNPNFIRAGQVLRVK